MGGLVRGRVGLREQERGRRHPKLELGAQVGDVDVGRGRPAQLQQVVQYRQGATKQPVRCRRGRAKEPVRCRWGGPEERIRYRWGPSGRASGGGGGASDEEERLRERLHHCPRGWGPPGGIIGRVGEEEPPDACEVGVGGGGERGGVGGEREGLAVRAYTEGDVRKEGEQVGREEARGLRGGGVGEEREASGRGGGRTGGCWGKRRQGQGTMPYMHTGAAATLGKRRTEQPRVVWKKWVAGQARQLR
jgi:hypothetical protein